MLYHRIDKIQDSAMVRRRRKLSKDMEKEISLIKKRIELITAIINDIRDDELQEEYRSAFQLPQNAYVDLSVEYDTNGFTDVSEEALSSYKKLIHDFENDFEI